MCRYPLLAFMVIALSAAGCSAQKRPEADVSKPSQTDVSARGNVTVLEPSQAPKESEPTFLPEVDTTQDTTKKVDEEEKTQQLLKIEKLKESKKYLSSTYGQQYFDQGLCSSDFPEFVDSVPYPDTACSSLDEEIEPIREACNVAAKCDLVSALIARDKLDPEWEFLASLGCSFNDPDRTLITTTAGNLEKLYCVAGRFKPKGKLGVLFKLGRAASCGLAIRNIIAKSNELNSCIANTRELCRSEHERWVKTSDQEKENYSLKKIIDDSRLETCTSETKILRELNLKSVVEIDEELKNISEQH